MTWSNINFGTVVIAEALLIWVCSNFLALFMWRHPLLPLYSCHVIEDHWFSVSLLLTTSVTLTVFSLQNVVKKHFWVREYSFLWLCILYRCYNSRIFRTLGCSFTDKFKQGITVFYLRLSVPNLIIIQQTKCYLSVSEQAVSVKLSFSLLYFLGLETYNQALNLAK